MRKFSMLAASLALGASGMAAQAAPVLTFSTTATAKPNNLVQYILSVQSTGGSVGVAGFDLTITSALNHLNQVSAGNTRFQDNNSFLQGFGQDTSLDTQFLFLTNNGSFNSNASTPFDTTSKLAGGGALINAQSTNLPLAQVVLPAGETATFSGTINFFQGLEAFQTVSGSIPVPEPTSLAFIGLVGAGLFRRSRKA